MKLAGSCFLSSQHSEWFTTRDRAMGSSYWQRKFPRVFRAEEGGYGLWADTPPFCCFCAQCCCLIAALLLSHQAGCAGGLRRVTTQWSHRHSQDSWVCTLMVAHPVGGWRGEQRTLPFLQHHPIPSVQLYWAYRHSTVPGHLTQGRTALACENFSQPHLRLSGILQPGQQSRKPTRKGFKLGQVFE